MTVPGVVNEFGSLKEFDVIELIDLKEMVIEKKDTDRHLVETAKYLQVPVISEDKKILMHANRGNLPFFNTLMIMNFMIYKNVISMAEYQAGLDLLQEEAYYDAFIFEYGKMVLERIIEKKSD